VPNAGTDGDDLSLAKRIEGEVDKLSEVKSSAAFVSGDKAVVAVEFDEAYKGEMTDRITQMIVEKAKQVDSRITNVSVTDDPDMMTDVKDMRTRADGGDLLADIKAEFDKLFQRLNPTA
jgi:YhcN/YlaJ family sporulation lipoprotein